MHLKNVYKNTLTQKYFGRVDFKRTVGQSVIAYNLLKLDR